ncbi:MAG TPA: anti-sigma factor [Bauldia sp.]|nr:anti-sigma factor [Bauldia sp.]
MAMMAGERDETEAMNAELVAYLDDALAPAERAAVAARLAADPALRARLDRLGAGGLPSTEGFDLLLAAAPDARLSAILAEATAEADATVARRVPWRRLAAAAVVLLVAGGIAGFAASRVLAPPVVEAEAPGWRDVVAEYFTLYSNDTLAVIPDGIGAAELAGVGERLSLALTPEVVALPDLALKRAQLLEFRGMPLAQIAYQSADDGPVAFCIIANGRPDAPIAFEEREGQNIVFWTKGGRGYMIIGRLPRPALEALASTLEGRVS